ncbi:hypothetical protein IJH97_01490 [Candidatus Saccharibacteria bacterium]|nr:hypothetical protein [Candidatus Saccharibacteria bacterium]
MKKTLEKSGQKIARRWSRFSRKASEESKEHIKENLIRRISHVRHVRLLILEWVLLIAAITFLAITQTFWYSESYATEAFTTGGTYTEANLGKVNSLNPLFATTSSEKTLAKLMFASITAPDYSGHTGLDLADNVKARDNSGKVWAIKLREDLKWSDGEPITNADVLYTTRVIQDPKVNTPYRKNLRNVSISEEEGYLIFNLPSADANFPTKLEIPVLPEHILKNVSNDQLLEHTFSTNPVTSGPFNYNATQAVGSDGEKIVYLTPNKYYYNGVPMLDSFVVHAYLTTDDIISAMQSGTVTATAALPAIDGEKVKSATIYEKQSTLSAGVYAFLNTDSPVLNRKNLRQALRQGLDVDTLRKLAGNAPALNYPFTSTQVDFSNFPALPEHNVDAAKEAIAAAGLGENDVITIATVSAGYLPELAENMANQLTSLGLRATTAVYEPNQDFMSNIIKNRAYDILIYEIELGPDTDLYPYYHSSQASESGGLNLSNYRNKLADGMILSARSTMNENERIAKYQTFLKYWIDDVPAIGIYQSSMSYYFNHNVRTYSDDNRLTEPTDRFADVYYWAATKTKKNRTP